MSRQSGKTLEAVTSHPEMRFSDLIASGDLRFKELAAGADIQFAYDGRAALFQLFSAIHRMRRETVLLPAFHCPTVVEPAIQAGYSVRFYRVKEDMSIDVNDFLRCLDETVAAALVINYFGFPLDIGEVSTACRTNATSLIEDCAHSFLSANPIRLTGDRADFAIYSFKKLVPSNVGGAVRCNVEDLDVKANGSRPPLRESAVTAKRMLDQAIEQSNNRLLAHLQSAANSTYRALKRSASQESVDSFQQRSHGDYAIDERLLRSGIPRLARHILEAADLKEVVAARQENYEFLKTRLTSVAGVEIAMNRSVQAVCPWALPVVLGNRSQVDHVLRARGVPLFTFGETLHSGLFLDRQENRRAIESAEYLASHLLCLSTHQNLSSKKLESVGQEVAKVMENT